VVSSYGLQCLPIAKAFELYDLLEKYLSEPFEEEHIIDFIGTIVDSIVADNSTAFIDALCLMTNMDVETIMDFSSEMHLKLFATGLTINDITGLREFCKDIGYVR